MKNRILMLLMLLAVLLSGCNLIGTTKENKSIDSFGIFLDYKDKSVVGIDIFDPTYSYYKFEVDEDMKKTLKDKNIIKNSLVKIKFTIEKDSKTPKLIDIEKSGEAVVKVSFNGMADENFAEFKLGSKIFIFQVDEKLINEFNDMKEGNKLTLKVIASREDEGNLIIKEIIK